MQELILLNETEMYIQSNGKTYQDTKDNFLLDYGKVIPQMQVAQIVVNDEGNTVVDKLQDINNIDYNRTTKQCWLNGHGFQTYPNEVCEDILNSIDTLLANKEKREYVEPTLDELKTAKIVELKNTRDTLEVEPISYNGNLFDFDDKARDRINSAIIALSITGQSIEWTTADNTNVIVTADDLKAIVANVAVRSNQLHVKYRELKEQVLVCTSKEELDNIKWGGENNV